MNYMIQCIDTICNFLEASLTGQICFVKRLIGHSFREEFASKKMDPYYILRLRLEGLCEAVYMYNIV